MSDFGSYNYNLQILLNTLKSSDASSEEKQKAISEVEKLQNLANIGYLKELDTNNDGVITQREYEKSKEYIEYLHLSTQLSLARKSIQPTATSTQTTESYDLDDNSHISTLEYEAELYSKTHSTQDSNNMLQNYLNYILELQSEKKLTNPSDVINELKIRIGNFEQELNSGKYNKEEIEKYLLNLNSILGRVKSQISVSYDRQYMANHIDSERTANRENKKEFLSSFNTLISPYQNLLKELRTTHTDFAKEVSYSIATYINRIKTAANSDSLFDVNYTMRRIESFIQQIEMKEHDSAFLGEDRNKYFSKETAELIKMALSKSKESVLAKLNDQYNNEADETKKAGIQSRIADFTKRFDDMINEYQTLADNATSRKRTYKIPENIKPLFAEIAGAQTIQQKRDKLKDIQSVIDDMISDISAKYILLAGDDKAEARYELRSELKNLYDLKEVCNIPDNISNDILGTTSGQDSIMTALGKYYSKFGEFNTEAGISKLKTDIRALIEKAGIYQQKQNKIDSYLEQFKNAFSQETRNKLRTYIKETMTDFSDARKKIIYNNEITSLNELIKTLEEKRDNDNGENARTFYNNIINQVRAEIAEIQKDIEKLPV